jgi:syntaxin-binding protein 1
VAETRQRLLLFVAGGMTYSEMREAYLLSNQLGKDIFVGAWIGLGDGCFCFDDDE